MYQIAEINKMNMEKAFALSSQEYMEEGQNNKNMPPLNSGFVKEFAKLGMHHMERRYIKREPWWVFLLSTDLGMDSTEKKRECFHHWGPVLLEEKTEEK